MRTKDICNTIEEFAPLCLQEDWDNAGLLIDNGNAEVTGVLFCLDVTEEIMKEALTKKCNFILSHHPLIFSGVKKITGSTYIERCVMSAIKNNIAIYAAHTNADSVNNGVSGVMCNKLGLENCTILSPQENSLLKLVTFVPKQQAGDLRGALFEVGAGHIGNYDDCSFNSFGEGTFRGNEESKPFVGKANVFHTESEVRIEMILPTCLKAQIESKLLQSHPYEEPAYDFIPLQNARKDVGLGMIGTFETEISEEDFIQKVKYTFGAECVRTSPLQHKKIRKVAVCGGSGSFLIETAKVRKADAFLTADLKYHDFFKVENQLLLTDIGHFESEQFIKEVFFDLISKKMPTFALYFSEKEVNYVHYF